jgi:dihydrodipicolinate synthase/N-acetylneuraminate lyase
MSEGRRVALALNELGIDGILLMPFSYAAPDRESLIS